MKVWEMCGQSEASISQAKQKPQARSPRMVKGAAPPICHDLNQDSQTKKAAWHEQLYSL